ncbi:MAG: 30S ribosomal protein S20 [Gammaproteobacteria bacterium]|nr:30S ribosomal protein S20 [Gammaproteobacteria bacterium]
MANIKSSAKRARQAVKRRAHNMALRSRVRTSIKKVLAAVEQGDKSAAESAYREAVPVIDTMVTKGMMHRNKAARHKSRLNARVRQLS